MKADLTSHRIEGIAVMGDTPFSVDLITEVLPDLWQGGCLGGFELDGFEAVLSLYPWEKYRLAEGAELREFPLYDRQGMMPERIILEDLAQWAIDRWHQDKVVLIHCQAGLNRSALITAIALVKIGYNIDAAITMLREKRSPAVLCNPEFEAWLRKTYG